MVVVVTIEGPHETDNKPYILNFDMYDLLRTVEQHEMAL